MRKAFLYLLPLLLLLTPSQSHAIPQAVDNLAPCQPVTASIVLQSADQASLERVRSLKASLAARGQDPAIITALYKASLKTGVSFDVLVLKAALESDLGRIIVSDKSSARGVFQYIDATWLGVMKHYGERIGYAHYAKAITFTKGGAAVKGNNAYLKAEILSLRYDPEISALVKAYQILDETQMLQNMKGAKPTTTDHYIAHMLGLPLAKEFYRLKRQGSIFTLASVSNPQMREAVRMNKGFFYHKGRPLTAAASYRRFEKIVGAELKKIEAASSATPTPICLAQ